MGEDKSARFRGGKKSARDRLFGVDDPGFWNWYHRKEKGRTGGSGRDFGTVDEVRELYDEWVQLGRPKAK
ncbi:hypothetical protein [Methylobacterium sp. SyP6R]|uniref:hypothetical protein n=1 Tax=Methylobacterium sp. SyP6R TaxID=2718876 RepID=UPI001F2A2491|nr:hypothetical protein [Methylobacterium sp. SyP6R]MCF4128441.1 hypothetical protein [Methylobacterium sp. SyP6R]